MTVSKPDSSAWFFSNSELRNLQEILLTVAMLMGLETARTNTETVGVLQQWSSELSEVCNIFIIQWIFTFSG